MPLNQADYDYLCDLVKKCSAIALDERKSYLVEARLAPLARRAGFESLPAFVACLRAGPASGLRQQVVEAMTTNETSFFRDVYPFECLRRSLLPDLLHRRAGERRLTIWSAGCSSGQEPYSVALLLREHFPTLAGWDVRIIGSDLSQEMLERARQGRYSQAEVNRGLPAQLLVKYFRRQGLEWELHDGVRRMVEFRPLNLIEPWPPLPPLDVVFVRNVLIYFGADTRREVLGKVRRVLRPDGTLFLGGAETALNMDDTFERVPQEGCGCYRLRERAPATAAGRRP
jgi:chemotaxis protein methyltransferase CheR